MLFLEDQARFWLVVHLVLGVSVTAAATHQAVWMRGYLRGRYGRHRGARRFAWIVLALFVGNFVVGNLIYPVYKVRVRVEYLDDPRVARAEYEARAAALAGTEPAAALPPPVEAKTLHAVSRWFDIKEHWIGLGLALAFVNAALMHAWRPREHGGDPARLALALAVALAATTWAAAIIGVVVTSYRSVGA